MTVLGGMIQAAKDKGWFLANKHLPSAQEVVQVLVQTGETTAEYASALFDGGKWIVAGIPNTKVPLGELRAGWAVLYWGYSQIPKGESARPDFP
jgi:hypothetical protein